MSKTSDIRRKKILVTGACGFIGTNLVSELIALGAKVTALDLPTADWSNVPSSTKRVKADILDKKALAGSCREIDIIYHLAARTDLDGQYKSDYRVNFEGTKNVIDEAFRTGGVGRFVFYSTQLVVGLFDETRFIDESEPYRTKTFYGESKIEGEKITKQYCEKASIPYTIIRPTSVYGPWGETPYKEFFRVIKRRRYFHVGKAANLVSWVYVKNLTNLTIMASLSNQAENETYFGNDLNPYSMHEIVEEVAAYYKIRVSSIPDWVITPVAYGLGLFKTMGLNVPIYPSRLKNIKASYCYDIKKSISLGYHPKYNLAAGIKETLDWYEQNKLI